MPFFKNRQMPKPIMSIILELSESTTCHFVSVRSQPKYCFPYFKQKVKIQLLRAFAGALIRNAKLYGRINISIMAALWLKNSMDHTVFKATHSLVLVNSFCQTFTIRNNVLVHSTLYLYFTKIANFLLLKFLRDNMSERYEAWAGLGIALQAI